MRFLQAARRAVGDPHPHSKFPVSITAHRLDTIRHFRTTARAGTMYVDIPNSLPQTSI
jgi:hypothetical protein